MSQTYAYIGNQSIRSKSLFYVISEVLTDIAFYDFECYSDVEDGVQMILIDLYDLEKLDDRMISWLGTARLGHAIKVFISYDLNEVTKEAIKNRTRISHFINSSTLSYDLRWLKEVCEKHMNS